MSAFGDKADIEIDRV